VLAMSEGNPGFNPKFVKTKGYTIDICKFLHETLSIDEQDEKQC
jgi:hypothetical protein